MNENNVGILALLVLSAILLYFFLKTRYKKNKTENMSLSVRKVSMIHYLKPFKTDKQGYVNFKQAFKIKEAISNQYPDNVNFGGCRYGVVFESELYDIACRYAPLVIDKIESISGDIYRLNGFYTDIQIRGELPRNHEFGTIEGLAFIVWYVNQYIWLGDSYYGQPAFFYWDVGGKTRVVVMNGCQLHIGIEELNESNRSEYDILFCADGFSKS